MSFEEFIDKYKHLFNKLVIAFDCKIHRLLGFAEDELDYYFILKDRSGKEIWHTAVGGIIDITMVDRYKYLDNVFHINHCPRIDVIRLERE